ncbi:MAG: hypothetical protein RMJ98_04380 [Myxococcales bacterium]|nr:hypothetical protein [Myxococcales bacterium]
MRQTSASPSPKERSLLATVSQQFADKLVHLDHLHTDLICESLLAEP